MNSARPAGAWLLLRVRNLAPKVSRYRPAQGKAP